jgi:hypothetical protein
MRTIRSGTGGILCTPGTVCAEGRNLECLLPYYLCRSEEGSNEIGGLCESDEEEIACDEICFDDIEEGFCFPPSDPGLVQVPCPSYTEGDGASLECTTEGEWNGIYPDLSECKSLDISDQLSQLLEDDGDGDPIYSIVDEVNDLVSNGTGTLTGSDILELLDFMELSETAEHNEAESPGGRPAITNYTIVAVKLTDTVLGEVRGWQTIPEALRRESVARLMDHVDRVGFLFLCHSEGFGDSQFDSLRMELETRKDEAGNFGREILYRKGNSYIEVKPREVLEGRDPLHAVFVSYDTLHEILKAKSNGSSAELSSTVIGASLKLKRNSECSFDDDKEFLTDASVTYRVQHTQENPGRRSSTCVYMDPYRNDWVDYSCRALQVKPGFSVCRCEHLTNFAALMDLYGSLPDESNELLVAITIPGTVISLVCLLLSVLVFSFVDGVRGEKVVVHRNLCMSLFAAQLSMLVGFERTGNRGLCAAMAAFTHYSFLCAFSWMMAEGVLIFYKFVVIFHTERRRSRYYYLFCYGIPAVIVACTGGITEGDAYGNERYCWLNGAFIWAFAGPVALVVLANGAILASAMITISCSKRLKSSRAEQSEVLLWIRSTAVLSTLLGTTWIVGFFLIDEAATAIGIVFTVLNSLQGAGIGLCHVFLDKSTRAAMWKSLGRRFKVKDYKTLSTPLRSSSRSHSHQQSNRF